MSHMIYKTLLLEQIGTNIPACSLCGGLKTEDMSELELKGVSLKRQARFMELDLRLKAAKLEGKTHKIWQTVGDGKIRDSHVRANKQKVYIEDDFTVGTEKLFLPSDPSASFAETANCRCDVTFEKGPISEVSGKLNNLTISRIAYGEFRSHSWKSSGVAPEGLADAVVSAGMACQRGNPCEPDDGTNATGQNLAAWNNIRRATGGVDRTGGGDLMCVESEGCKYVHSAYTWIDGVKTLVKRDKPLTPSGIVTIRGSHNGDLPLYFYKLPFKGWLHRRDLQGPPKE